MALSSITRRGLIRGVAAGVAAAEATTSGDIVGTVRAQSSEVAREYQVHHTRPGQFGRFDEAAVVGAARELALALVEKVGPR